MAAPTWESGMSADGRYVRAGLTGDLPVRDAGDAARSLVQQVVQLEQLVAHAWLLRAAVHSATNWMRAGQDHTQDGAETEVAKS